MWQIAEQGLHSKNLIIDIAHHDDGCVLTFKVPAAFYKIYFSPSGQITHIRHYDPTGAIANELVRSYDAKTPMVAIAIDNDRPRDVRA